MTALGQTEKSSYRAYLVRFIPDSHHQRKHCAIVGQCQFRNSLSSILAKETPQLLDGEFPSFSMAYSTEKEPGFWRGGIGLSSYPSPALRHARPLTLSMQRRTDDALLDQVPMRHGRPIVRCPLRRITLASAANRFRDSRCSCT